MNFLLKTTYLFKKHKLISTNTYMKEDYLTEKKVKQTPEKHSTLIHVVENKNNKRIVMINYL